MTVEFSAHEHVHMARALGLAATPRNACDPNPRVGCVIVSGDTVVGHGWHHRAGEPHAEIIALREAGDRARGATVFVTLEPCCVAGRTPPCTGALIAAGVGRVVAASTDPNPRVDGQGMKQLAAAGIDVASGLLAAEARALNRGFFSRMRAGRPFVCSKIAASLDGRTALADGTSQWISSRASRHDVQRLRARASAILTGVGTVIADDPRLTVRLDADDTWQMPVRVIADTGLRTPPAARMLQLPGATLIVAATDAPAAREARLSEAGARVHRVAAAADGIDLRALLRLLAGLEINEVLVEAGPALNGAILGAGLLDELIVYQAPHLLGPDARPMFRFPPLTDMSTRPAFELVGTRRVGVDWRLRLVPRSV